MKINEVEQLVGISKRNIRFYEKEGLLAPGRNSENGYRDYSDSDVTALKQIKLFRKLDLPMEEIRRIQQGILTLPDAMRRHTIQLERQRTNLAVMVELCRELEEEQTQLSALDTDRYLRSIEEREKGGTRFVNIKKNDVRVKYAAPVIAAVVMIALMVAVIALLLWETAADPAGAPPTALLIFLIAVPAVVICGVILALIQRFKQIKGGEEDAASQY